MLLDMPYNKPRKVLHDRHQNKAVRDRQRGTISVNETHSTASHIRMSSKWIFTNALEVGCSARHEGTDTLSKPRKALHGRHITQVQSTLPGFPARTRFTGLRRLQGRTSQEGNGFMEVGGANRPSLQGECWNPATQPYYAWHVLQVAHNSIE